MKSSSRSIPIALEAEPTKTGASRAFVNPSLAPWVMTASGSVPSSRYCSIKRVVGLRDRLDQLLARGIGDPMDLVGPVGLLGMRARRVEVRLLVEQVGDAVEILLRADRELERRDLVPEGGHELVEGGLEVRALAIQLVHEDRARQILLDGELPRELGLDLDAVDRGDHDDHRVRGADRRAHVADEVGGAGGVQAR